MLRQTGETREAVQVILQVAVVMATQVGIAVANTVAVPTEIAEAIDPVAITILHLDIPVTDRHDTITLRADIVHLLISV